jgi:hypothetical protein
MKKILKKNYNLYPYYLKDAHFQAFEFNEFDKIDKYKIKIPSIQAEILIPRHTFYKRISTIVCH